MEDPSTGPAAPVAAPIPVSLPPAWPALVFVLAVVWAVVSRGCTMDVAVDAAVLDRVAAELRALPPRSFVLVHPSWRTDVVAGLSQRLGGVELGPALPPDAMDGRRPVVAVRVPRAPGPASLWKLKVDERRDVAGLELLFVAGANRAVTPENTPPPQSAGGAWSMMEALRGARVEVTGGRTVACNAWDGANGRWVCPGMDDWNFVGPRLLGVEGQGRSCLWAHPVTGATLSITFPAVPLGKTLRVGHALADGAAGAPGGQPVALVVTAGGARAQLEHPNAPGFREDRLETPGAGNADVRLDITTPHDGARHFCVTLAVEP